MKLRDALPDGEQRDQVQRGIILWWLIRMLASRRALQILVARTRLQARAPLRRENGYEDDGTTGEQQASDMI